MHRIDEVLETVIRPRYTCFFSTDASNRYFAIKIKPEDEYKAGIVTPHSQYLYLHIGQGLRGALYTYTQFTDLVFSSLLKSETQVSMSSIIDIYEEGSFSPFIDNYLEGFKNFDSQFQFLHKRYFSRVAFELISLSARKTRMFIKTLELIGFIGSSDSFRLSVKHQEWILN
jgi:hypothetical protein